MIPNEEVYLNEFIELSNDVSGISISIQKIVRLHELGVFELFFKHEPIRGFENGKQCFIDETKAYLTKVTQELNDDRTIETRIERINSFLLKPYDEYKVFKFWPNKNTKAVSIASVSHIIFDGEVHSLLQPVQKKLISITKKKYPLSKIELTLPVRPSPIKTHLVQKVGSRNPSERIYLKGKDVQRYFKKYYGVEIPLTPNSLIKTERVNNFAQHNASKKSEAEEKLSSKTICEEMKKKFERNKKLSFTGMCKDLGSKYGVSEKTIQRRIEKECPDLKKKIQEKK
ncbi:MAG: hypothetical protein U9R28_11810 [Pseudomonadota bacterium]|nr:hypothetical protein [Pseudomonadota bacterium]